MNSCLLPKYNQTWMDVWNISVDIEGGRPAATPWNMLRRTLVEQSDSKAESRPLLLPLLTGLF